jgi:branched-chain amino acid transport system permease protein
MMVIAGQLLVAGTAYGGVYALIAVAFSLIYRGSRVINFAQGYLASLGAYATFAGLVTWKLPYPVAIAFGVIVVVLLSLLVERFAFRPLYRFGPLLVIVSSIALTFVLETTIQLLWGARALKLPALVPGAFWIGDVVISWQQANVLFGLALAVLILQFLFRGRTGRAMRAAAENADVAGLLGIEARRMIGLTFVLSAVLTAIAGVLVAPLTYLEPSMGGSLGLLGIVAAIVGGLGNIYGAVAGGFVIGLVNVFGAYAIGGNFVEPITFLVLVVVLLLRPQGIFGEEGTAVRA